MKIECKEIVQSGRGKGSRRKKDNESEERESMEAFVFHYYRIRTYNSNDYGKCILCISCRKHGIA